MTEHFVDIIDANRRYAESFELGGLAAAAAKGLAVVTCIDSRIEPLPMLGLQPGDAKILRNAGARVTGDAVRSLVLATNLLSVRRIMVVAHTDCAVAGVTDEMLREQIASRNALSDLSGFELHAALDQTACLAADVQRLRDSSQLAPGVTVGGFVYDVTTGLLVQVE